MSSDLFGAETTKEGAIKLVYQGSSFVNGQMQIRALYTELESAEKVIRRTVAVLIATGKLDETFRDLEIYVQVERGSVRETIKVIFNKSVLGHAAANLITGVLLTSYGHFLDKGSAPDNKYTAEIAQLENDKQFKEGLKNIISPLHNSDDAILIQDNHGTINIITQPQKETIVRNLEAEEKEDPFLKNGEFEEQLTGVIRKLDLDASSGNYFGFNIDGGATRVPTSWKGEFHLNDIKDVINTHISISASVRYKNDEIKHIQILNYRLLEKQADIDFKASGSQ